MYNVHTYTQIVSYIFFQISVNRAIKLKGAACRYLFAIFSQKLNKSNLQTRMDFLRRIFVYVVRLVFSTRHCARVCVWQSSLAAVIVPIMWACMWPMCGLCAVCGTSYFSKFGIPVPALSCRRSFDEVLSLRYHCFIPDFAIIGHSFFLILTDLWDR